MSYDWCPARSVVLNSSFWSLELFDEVELSSRDVGRGRTSAREEQVLAKHTYSKPGVKIATVKLLLHHNAIMRWLFSFLLLAFLGAVQALSSTGSRLLVILEEESEREKYSVLLEDLSGKCN